MKIRIGGLIPQLYLRQHTRILIGPIVIDTEADHGKGMVHL